MSTLPFGLGTPVSSGSLSNSDLQYMGKRASSAYLAGDGSLNENIVKISQEQSGLNRNHVQRVVEHANQETFSTLFTKEAGDRNVQFDLADPKVVLEELNYGKVKESYDLSDYSESPASSTGEIDAANADAILMEAFGVEGHEKVASAVKDAKRGLVSNVEHQSTSKTKVSFMVGESGYERDDPYRELIVSKQKVAKAFDDISFAKDKNERMVKEAQANFNYHSTQHVLGDGSLSEIASIMDGLNYSDAMAKVAMSDLVDHLAGKGVDLNAERAKSIYSDMTKKAHRIVNIENPVVQALSDLQKVAEAQPTLDRAFVKVANEYKKLQDAVGKAMVSSGVF